MQILKKNLQAVIYCAGVNDSVSFFIAKSSTRTPRMPAPSKGNGFFYAHMAQPTHISTEIPAALKALLGPSEEKKPKKKKGKTYEKN